MNIKPFAAAVLAATSVSAFAVGRGSLGTIDNAPISISNIVPMGIFQDVYSFTLADPGGLVRQSSGDQLRRLTTSSV